jgi:hypothetical protein
MVEVRACGIRQVAITSARCLAEGVPSNVPLSSTAETARLRRRVARLPGIGGRGHPRPFPCGMGLEYPLDDAHGEPQVFRRQRRADGPAQAEFRQWVAAPGSCHLDHDRLPDPPPRAPSRPPTNDPDARSCSRAFGPGGSGGETDTLADVQGGPRRAQPPPGAGIRPCAASQASRAVSAMRALRPRWTTGSWPVHRSSANASELTPNHRCASGRGIS